MRCRSQSFGSSISGGARKRSGAASPAAGRRGGRAAGAADAAPGDRSGVVHRMRRLRAGVSGGRDSRAHQRQGRAGRALRMHRPRRLPGGLPERRHPSRLRHGTARRRYSRMSAPTSRPMFPACSSPASSAAWASSATPSSRAAKRSIRCGRSTGWGGRICYDVVIVGGGPAGFSASLAAMQHKLRFVTIEQDSFGGTVAHFPRGKLVMTAPADLPLIGKVKFKEVSKERLLEFWQRAAQRTGLRINYGERVEGVTRIGARLRGHDDTRPLSDPLGAAGDRPPRHAAPPRGSGRGTSQGRLPPDRSATVRGQHVLVVGGGDSALEAAASIAAEDRHHRYPLPPQRRLLARQAEEPRARGGGPQVRPPEDSDAIRGQEDRSAPCWARVRTGKRMQIENDAVIVCAGGILPTPFLKSIGIEVETKYGIA